MRQREIEKFKQPAGMVNRKTGLTIRHRRMSVVRIQRVYFGENIRSFSSGQMKLSVGSTVTIVNPPLSPPGGYLFQTHLAGWASERGGP